MSFYCTCGFEKQLSYLAQVSSHMSQCPEFQNGSIIYQNLDRGMLQTMSVDQLLIFKADLSGWLDRINEKISDSDGLLDVGTRKQEGSSSNQEINCQKRSSDPVTLKDSQEQEVIDIEESDIEDLDLLPQQTRFPPRRLDFSFSNINTHSTCETCASGKGIQTNICGHGLCQQCFVDMYRKNQDLKCQALNCPEPLERALVLELCYDQYRSECSICEKFFPTKCAVKKHSYVHLKAQKKFVCDNCNQSYYNYQELQEHRSRKHGSISGDGQLRRQQFQYRMKPIPDYGFPRERLDYGLPRLDYGFGGEKIDYGFPREREDRFITLSEESYLEEFEPPLQRRQQLNFNNEEQFPTLIEDD